MYKMDVFVTVFVILGSLGIHTVAGQLLHCLECTHIIWNPENRTNHQNELMQQQGGVNPGFTWIDSISNMLVPRSNPACASDDPYRYNGQTDPKVIPGNQINGISEAVCQAFSSAERCNFMYGVLGVWVQQYNKYIQLTMYVRNCRQEDPIIDDRCYDRNTNLGYSKIRITFQNLLVFFGPGTTVTTFSGRQCLCSYDRCLTFTQGSSAVTGSVVTLLSAALAYLVLKV